MRQAPRLTLRAAIMGARSGDSPRAMLANGEVQWAVTLKKNTRALKIMR